MKSSNYKEIVIIDGSNVKSFTPELIPSKLFLSFSAFQPSKEQKEKFWIRVRNPEEAAYYTILLIE